jgi:hypothetical protein
MMGRWTPLVLMAGGLAVLLGTLVGILSPLGGRNTASVPGNNRQQRSQVLPANINVNSTAAGNGTGFTAGTANNDRNKVAQNNATTPSETTGNTQDITQDGSATSETPSTDTTPTQSGNNQSNGPIRALW